GPKLLQLIFKMRLHFLQVAGQLAYYVFVVQDHILSLSFYCSIRQQAQDSKIVPISPLRTRSMTFGTAADATYIRRAGSLRKISAASSLVFIPPVPLGSSVPLAWAI